MQRVILQGDQVNHGHVLLEFLVPCKKCLVQCTSVQKKSRFTRYQKIRPCLPGQVVYSSYIIIIINRSIS